MTTRMTTSNKLLFIGEPMLELVSGEHDTLKKSFAGDVYNTSVYIKRAFPQSPVYFMTGLGHDKLSAEFATLAQSESIDTSLIGHSTTKHIGAYLVVTDATGERSFVYWRSDSAAKRMMTLISESQALEATSTFSHIFFSGITIAILEPSERSKFWAFLKAAKANGASVIFDPNYRPALWINADEAKQEYELAYQISDWLMPGLDDFSALYGIDTIEQCIEFCRPYQFAEIVIKQGEDPVYVLNADGQEVCDIQRSDNVVDTTSAGDAFNGVYLGARFAGKCPKEAVNMANYAAMKVIETKGAIMPKVKFLSEMAAYAASSD